MDSLDNYIAVVSKENKILLDPSDPVCVLHTMLAKFEIDLLEQQKQLLYQFGSEMEAFCQKVEIMEKSRAEKALSYVKSRSEQMMLTIPGIISAELRKDEVKEILLQYALEIMKDRITVSIPPVAWGISGCLVILNILTIAIALAF